jgi:UPF0176 protein
MENKPYDVIAYYYFGDIQNPHEEVRLHKKFFEGRDITSRIYISEEGINGQMSALRSDGQAYIEWMQSRSQFKDIHFKIHPYHEQAFPRCTVKYRKKLVAIDSDVKASEGGDHMSPEEWEKMLESGKDFHLLDIRNDYEWAVGHFEGAELPPCETFRQFADYADTIEDRTKPVLMYCTGGIRCELFSAVMKKKGFDKVYQLDGGIINYGLKSGSKHWLGKLFVFDDRLTIPISEEETPVIGKCHYCDSPADNYYNCSNMDCNSLFLCCDSCADKSKGCCCETCIDAPRVRPYREDNRHKPFRRKHMVTRAES